MRNLLIKLNFYLLFDINFLDNCDISKIVKRSHISLIFLKFNDKIMMTYKYRRCRLKKINKLSLKITTCCVKKLLKKNNKKLIEKSIDKLHVINFKYLIFDFLHNYL